MKRRSFVKVLGISAYAISASGFSLRYEGDRVVTDCKTSTDILGPFYRAGAPYRTNLNLENDDTSLIPLKVKGKVFGADCSKTLANITIDIWHCDQQENYDMVSKEYRCRAKINTDNNGNYWFKTAMPPPYGLRPKHIHFLIHESKNHKELVTQLYFKGDTRIKKDNWIKYPWDEKRILDIHKNADGESEVTLDLYLEAK